MTVMAIDDIRQAARHLAGQVQHVAHASGREPWREILQRLTRGKYGRRQGWARHPRPEHPLAGHHLRRTTRLAYPQRPHRQRLRDPLDYRTCPPCRLGWVENPYTHPRYRRNGLAAITLAQLRREHPGLRWHTLGGHFRDSRAFWTAVGADVPGGYQQRPPCSHVKLDRSAT